MGLIPGIHESLIRRGSAHLYFGAVLARWLWTNTNTQLSFPVSLLGFSSLHPSTRLELPTGRKGHQG